MADLIVYLSIVPDESDILDALLSGVIHVVQQAVLYCTDIHRALHNL